VRSAPVGGNGAVHPSFAVQRSRMCGFRPSWTPWSRHR